MTARPKWLAIVGPTGSGKSALALALARALDGEIISCDSVQLYRRFDIGSAKPSLEEQSLVKHHLIDCFDWHEDCDAARYALLARDMIDTIAARGRLPIVVGGTGLYLRALLAEAFHDELPKDPELRASLQQDSSETLYQRLQALDPLRAQQLHPNDRFRVIRALELTLLLGEPVSSRFVSEASPPRSELRNMGFLIVLEPPRASLHRNISQRTEAMLAAGLIKEVQGLLADGIAPDCKPMLSIGYKQVVHALQSQQSYAELAATIDAATRQYAKRQCTWFRKVDADQRLSIWEPRSVINSLQAIFGSVP